MAPTQEDLELLETYLDHALDPDAVQTLERRLTQETDLAAALTQLQSQRDLRAAVWSALEPDEQETREMTWRVRGAMAERRDRQFSFSSGPLSRWGAAAAACIVLGFFGGWLGRGQQGGLAGQGGLPQSPGQTSQSFVLNPPTSSAVLVPVTNEYGQVVAWQPFQNPDDAKHFTEDLNRSHAPAIGAPQDDKINLTSFDKF